MDKGVQKSQRSGQTLRFYEVEMGEGLTLPYAEEGIFAGFPSPAQDDRLESIDLNRELIRHPATTFLARIVGDSMEGANIYEGDIVVVDRALEVHDDDVVVCCVNGEFNIKLWSEGAMWPTSSLPIAPTRLCGSTPKTISSSGRGHLRHPSAETDLSRVWSDRLQQLLRQLRAGLPTRAAQPTRRLSLQ